MDVANADCPPVPTLIPTSGAGRVVIATKLTCAELNAVVCVLGRMVVPPCALFVVSLVLELLVEKVLSVGKEVVDAVVNEKVVLVDSVVNDVVLVLSVVNEVVDSVVNEEVVLVDSVVHDVVLLVDFVDDELVKEVLVVSVLQINPFLPKVISSIEPINE